MERKDKSKWNIYSEMLTINITYHEQEQQQHQQKQHGFWVCCRCSGAEGSGIGLFVVVDTVVDAPSALAVLRGPPTWIPPAVFPPEPLILEATTFVPRSLPPVELCVVEPIPRNRHPEGNSDTVQDILNKIKIKIKIITSHLKRKQ